MDRDGLFDAIAWPIFADLIGLQAGKFGETPRCFTSVKGEGRNVSFSSIRHHRDESELRLGKDRSSGTGRTSFWVDSGKKIPNHYLRLII
jgi:hypothetical protein